MANAQVNVGLFVNVEIRKENIHTGEVRIETEHNLAVDDGLNWIRDFMNNKAPAGIKMFAVGTGTNAEQSTDSQLQTEVFRAAPTKTDDTTSKQLIVTYYLSSVDANGNTLTEAGIFGGQATSAANSGTLVARVTYPGDAKTSAEAWTFKWTFGLQAV